MLCLLSIVFNIILVWGGAHYHAPFEKAKGKFVTLIVWWVQQIFLHTFFISSQACHLFAPHKMALHFCQLHTFPRYRERKWQNRDIIMFNSRISNIHKKTFMHYNNQRTSSSLQQWADDVVLMVESLHNCFALRSCKLPISSLKNKFFENNILWPK